jgi:lysozyme family protein
MTKSNGRRLVHADGVRGMTDLNALKRRRRAGLAEHLTKARLFSN